MDINKTFLVETSADGKTKIYNVCKRFFIGKSNSGGIMKHFDAEETTDKNAYIAMLKKGGWLPLSLEDIGKTAVNEIGIVMAYPFKYKKGFVTIEKIEAYAADNGIKWKSRDHFTNPFSALKDYENTEYYLEDNGSFDIKSHERSIRSNMVKIQNIGAIEVIENFFTKSGFFPDPRRFNKTNKELRLYYRHHLNECARLLLHRHIMRPGGWFNIDDVANNLTKIKSLQELIPIES